MANEKVIYEVALEGVASSVNQIGGLESKLSNLKFGGIVALNKELEKTVRLTNVVAALSPTGTKSYNRSHHLSVQPRLWKMVTAGWMGNLSDASARWQQSWSKVQPKYFGKYPQVGSGKPTTWMAEFQRAKNRLYGDWGTGKMRKNAVLSAVLGGKAPLLLGWNGLEGAAVNDQSWVDQLQQEKHNRVLSRRNEARAILERKFNLDAPVTNVNARPPTTNPVSASQTTWSNAPKANSLDVLKAAYYHANHKGDFIKFAGKVGERGGSLGVLAKIAKLGAVFNVLSWCVMGVVKVFKKMFDAFKVVAEDGERLHRESHVNNMGSGALTRQWFAAMAYGDSAASASALMGRFATDMAMLRFGGNGGAPMEAARLFGMSIFGKNGFADPTEMLRNANAKMQQLDPQAQHALASVLGLNAYQEHLARQSPEEFQRVMNKGRTMRMDVWSMGGNDVGMYSDYNQEVSHEFWESFAQLSVSFHEFMGVLGEAVLPILSLIFDVLSYIMQVLSFSLEIICKAIGIVVQTLRKILEFMTFKWMDTNEDVANSARMKGLNYYNDPDNETGTKTYEITIENISLNSLGLDDNASEDQIKEKASHLFKDILMNVDNGEK